MNTELCHHYPACSSPDSPAWAAAVVVHSCPEQGWSLLCNGVIAFDDGGCLLPDGRALDAPRELSAA